MGKSNNPVDVLIQNIKTDQHLLEEKTKILEEAKEEKRLTVERLKGYRKDVQHMMKYLSDEQMAEIEKLGLDVTESSGGRGTLNPISQIVIDVLMKAKGHTMTNGKLYSHYIDSVEDGEPESYSRFNVKIRQLFNGGRISKKQLDAEKSSRDDVITLHVSSDK